MKKKGRYRKSRLQRALTFIRTSKPVQRKKGEDEKNEEAKILFLLSNMPRQALSHTKAPLDPHQRFALLTPGSDGRGGRTLSSSILSTTPSYMLHLQNTNSRAVDVWSPEVAPFVGGIEETAGGHGANRSDSGIISQRSAMFRISDRRNCGNEH